MFIDDKGFAPRILEIKFQAASLPGLARISEHWGCGACWRSLNTGS
jgi:hypothetical protein